MVEAPCLVWLPVDHRLLGAQGRQMPYVVVGDKYARAVKHGAQAQPVLFPMADPARIGELLAVVWLVLSPVRSLQHNDSG